MNSKMNLGNTNTKAPNFEKEDTSFRKDKNFQLLIICDKSLKMKPIMCVYVCL